VQYRSSEIYRWHFFSSFTSPGKERPRFKTGHVCSTNL
jgi:hypothetical protein